MPEKAEPESPHSYTKVAENLYRNDASGRYYVWIKRGGKQIRRSLKTQDRKLAERWLKDFLDKADRLDPTKGKVQISFEEMADQWVKTLAPHLKESSYRRRETSIKQLSRFFKGKNIRTITKANCDEWAQKRSPDIAASTFNNERETLLSIFQYAEREGIIITNPAQVIKRRRQGKTQIVIPSRDQLVILLKTMRGLDPRYWPGADLVELLAYSGMRLGEAVAIKWGDIEFKRDAFTVTGGTRGTKNYDVRTVPLFPNFRAFLERLRAEERENGIDRNPESSIAPVGNAKKAIDAACKFSDLPHFSHHSMRHYFVSNAIEAGVDFKTIAAWVGHKDGGILVAQTYGHLRDLHSFEMAKLMK